jgi:hypothetical protein
MLEVHVQKPEKHSQGISSYLTYEVNFLRSYDIVYSSTVPDPAYFAMRDLPTNLIRVPNHLGRDKVERHVVSWKSILCTQVAHTLTSSHVGVNTTEADLMVAGDTPTLSGCVAL